MTSSFRLSKAAAEKWEALTGREPRLLPGLARLMQRPTPYSQDDDVHAE
jgi:hypothetical protein